MSAAERTAGTGSLTPEEFEDQHCDEKVTRKLANAHSLKLKLAARDDACALDAPDASAACRGGLYGGRAVIVLVGPEFAVYCKKTLLACQRSENYRKRSSSLRDRCTQVLASGTRRPGRRHGRRGAGGLLLARVPDVSP